MTDPKFEAKPESKDLQITPLQATQKFIQDYKDAIIALNSEEEKLKKNNII